MGKIGQPLPSAHVRLRWVAELGLLAVAVIWGFTFVVVQQSIHALPVLPFLAYRFLGSAAALLPFFGAQLGRLSLRGWLAGCQMGAFLTAGYMLQTFGLERTSVPDAGFITGLYVVLTPVLGTVFLRQRSAARVWIAAGCSCAGLALLCGPGAHAHLTGDLLVLGAAVSLAAQILATDRAIRQHPAGALLLVQLIVCGLVSLLLATATGQLVIPSRPSAWSGLAITSLLAGAAGFLVQTYAQRHTSPARTALILGSEPLFAWIAADVLQNSRLSATAVTGGLLILTSIVLVEARATRPLRLRTIRAAPPGAGTPAQTAARSSTCAPGCEQEGNVAAVRLPGSAGVVADVCRWQLMHLLPGDVQADAVAESIHIAERDRDVFV